MKHFFSRTFRDFNFIYLYRLEFLKEVWLFGLEVKLGLPHLELTNRNLNAKKAFYWNEMIDVTEMVERLRIRTNDPFKENVAVCCVTL